MGVETAIGREKRLIEVRMMSLRFEERMKTRRSLEHTMIQSEERTTRRLFAEHMMIRFEERRPYKADWY